MPTVKISKVKARRGSDAQRKSVVFDQGELIYTVDNKRLFVGSGTLNGESVVGSKVHPMLSNYTSLSTVNAEVGDLVNVNNRFYQLTAFNYNNINSWADVSTKIDTNILSYDLSNKLTLNFNSKSLELSAYQLSIKSSGIDEREISSSSFGYGLSGGSGDKIVIDADPYYFYNTNNTLSLSTDNLPKYDLTFDKLSSSWFGDGLIYNTGLQKIESELTGVDGVSLVKNLSGQVSIKGDALAGTNQWGSMTIDSFGRVTTNNSSIYSTLTGTGPTGP